MRRDIKEVCSDYIFNLDFLKANHRWTNYEILAISAASAATQFGRIQEDKYHKVREIIKNNTGIFSHFKGMIEVPSIVLLSNDSSPEERFQKTEDYYQILKEEFWGTEYLSLSALVLTDLVAENQLEEISIRAKRYYNQMKRSHPFLTSSEDSFLALLLALSQKDEDRTENRIETSYEILKSKFGKTNAVQASSHILSIADVDVIEKSHEMIALYDSLQDRGIKFGKYNEISSLASLVLGQASMEEILEEMLQVDEFLLRQKHYQGIFALGKAKRYFHGAILVGRSDDTLSPGSIQAISSTVALIAAQQAAMMAAIISTSVITSTSNN